MKIVLIYLIFVLNLSIYAAFPVMLKIKTTEKISQSIELSFRSGVEESLTKSGYTLIDEKTQEEALKEQANQHNSDCYDDACLIDTGKMLAAKGLFVVDIVLMKKDYLFKIRLIDFETGETKASASEFYSVKDIEDKHKLKVFSEKIANKILETLKPTKVIEKVESIDISINSNPKAKIFIDGVVSGETPFRQKIPIGIHSIKLEKDGFVDYEFKKLFSSDYDDFINLNRIIYIDVDPFDGLAYNIKGPCTIKEKKGILIINTQYKKECKLILANKNYKTQTIDLKNIKSPYSIILKKIDKYRVSKYITPSDAKVTLIDLDGNKYTIDESGSMELNKGKYSVLIERKDYFDKSIDITLDRNLDIRTQLRKGSFLKPYFSTELTISSNILYFSAGAALKIVEIGLSNSLTWGLNTKIYRNFTDGYFYTDFDLNLNLNLSKKIKLTVSLPIRILLTDKYSSSFGLLPRLSLDYTFYMINNLKIDAEFSTYTIFADNNDKKLFFTTGLNVGF